MKIFSNKELTEEILSLELGTVKVGETGEFIFYLFNDTNAELQDLEFSVNHNEVKIKEAPKVINKNSVAKLIIEWTPSITLKEGLKASLNLKGAEIWG